MCQSPLVGGTVENSQNEKGGVATVQCDTKEVESLGCWGQLEGRRRSVQG